MKHSISFNKVTAAFLIVLTVFMSFSCGSGEDNTLKDTPDVTTADTAAAETTVSYNVPEVIDGEGYEYRFLNKENETNPYGIYMVPEAEDGEIVNDSLIRRNRTVEEQYNITIDEKYVSDVGSNLKSSVMAGDDICDIAFISATAIYPLAVDGHVVDLAEIGTIQFDEPWWDERITDGYAVNDRVYIANGDIATGDDKRTFVIMFSKAMYEDYGFENPYDMAVGGTWTMDKMGTMIKGVSRDVNGDGLMDENDNYGYLSEYLALYYFYIASGHTVIERGDDGGYRYTIGDKESLDILEKIYNLITAEDTLWDYSNIKYETNVYATVFSMFGQKQILFNGRVVGDVYAFNMRDIESDYGFLPIPKYEESNEYRSFIQPDAFMCCMPASVPDKELSGLLTDVIAYRSMLDVSDAYYDSLLNEKAARSEEDKLMLKIVLDNKAVDIDGAGANTINSGIQNMFRTMFTGRSFTLASSWEAIRSAAEERLAKFVEKVG